MALKTGFVMDGKICVSQRKIMKTVIPLEKNIYFIMKILLIKETPFLTEH